MNRSLADWQLPPGVTRATWDYVHSPDVARDYDAGLAGTALLAGDTAFARRQFVRPGRLIDLGCGTGRLLLDFATRGFSVLGVDLSEEMLRTAAAKAEKAGVCLQLLKANLAELDAVADASFDYAACLFSTLGMIDGADNRRRTIAHAHRLLRPGGKFILHVHNRWFHLWDKKGRRWMLRDAVRSICREDEAGERIMPTHQGIAGLKLHHYTRREGIGLLTSAGFRVSIVEPVSLRLDGHLRCPSWFGWLRAYGYLILGIRPLKV